MGAGQNIALHALSTAGNGSFPISTCAIHSTLFFSPLIILEYKVMCNVFGLSDIYL